MDAKTTTEVIKKLVGSVNPIGETTTDAVRFNNLKLLTEVSENLLEIISHVHRQNKHSHEHSVRKAADHAGEFLERIKQQF